MRYQINSFEYLTKSIEGLGDDHDKDWSEYPCILWERGKSMGYGSLGTNNGGSVYAHWLAYETTYGAIPEGFRVRHKCGTHACFRPSHLYAHNNFAEFNKIVSGIAFDPSAPWNSYPCLLWENGKNGAGYGSISTPDGKSLVHRLSYKKFHGDPEQGLDICHKCDTPACYHPAHLFAGTRLENVQDMWSKGRQHDSKGEKAGRAQLTESQVLEIRRLYTTGMTHKAIAAFFPVSTYNIGCIVRRKSWTHI